MNKEKLEELKKNLYASAVAAYADVDADVDAYEAAVAVAAYAAAVADAAYAAAAASDAYKKALKELEELK